VFSELFTDHFGLRVVKMTNSVVSASGLELGQLVKIPELELRLVVGSELALSRVVSWAHATEMVDPRPHLRGAELVCTVGSALLNAENCARLVEAVKATDSAGICFGIGEVHTQIPKALIKECRRLSVSLMEMAHGVPFLAINDVLADVRVRAQAGTSQRDGQLVNKLLTALRENAPMEDILNVSAEFLGGWLTYQTKDHAIESIRGDSVFDESRDSLETLSITTGAALMPELQRAGLVGRSLTISAWPAETAPLLASHLPGALIADAPEATFVVTTSPETVYQTAHDLGLVCGHGSSVGISEISRGITEARATLQVARNHGKVAGPESLTSLTGLLEQQSSARLVPFVDQLIRPLVEHDTRRGSQLLGTLRTFIERHGSLQATAESQYLHVNTVRHRLGRVARLIGRNPLEYNDQISLAIALWAYDRSNETFRDDGTHRRAKSH
jgi:purine catabolism regulator